MAVVLLPHAVEHRQVAQYHAEEDKHMDTQETDLKSIVAKRRIDIHDIIAAGKATTGRLNNPRKEELYQLSLDADCTTSFNALYLFTHFDSHDLEWLQDRHGELIDRALCETSQRKLRMLLTLLLKQPFDPTELRTDFLDFCLHRMTESSHPYAIRALCMKLACKQMTQFPELTDELGMTLQLLDQQELSPGLLSARRQVETKIKAARKRH